MNKSTIAILLLASSLPALANIGDLPENPSRDILLDPLPGVERTTLVKSGLGFIRIDDELDALPSDGSLTRIVRDDSHIYLGNVFSWNSSPGWIEGTIEGDKAVFQLPQLVKDEIRDINGVLTPYCYYAVACDMVVRGDSGDMVPTVDQTYTFVIKEDGSLVPADDEIFMGNFLYADGIWEWNLDGDFYTSLTPQTLDPCKAPEGMEFTTMTLTYPHILYGGAYAKEVQVGFDGTDCYIKGMAVDISDLPDAIIKGKLDRSTGVVTFDSNQFLGDSWLFGFTQYLIGGETDFPTNGTYRPDFFPQDRLEFVWDPQKSTLTSDMSFIIVPSLQEDEGNLYYENIYNTPTISWTDPAAPVSKLNDPEVVSFTPASDGMPNVMTIAGSMVSADNQILDMSNLYFELYLDGMPFEFTPAIDPAMKEPASRIPFGTTDYQCFVAQEEIIQMVALPEMEIGKLEVRYVYCGDPDNPVYSDFSTVVDNSAVEQIADSATTACHYDLLGRRVGNPESGAGIRIRAMRLPDGSIRHEKVMIR